MGGKLIDRKAKMDPVEHAIDGLFLHLVCFEGRKSIVKPALCGENGTVWEKVDPEKDKRPICPFCKKAQEEEGGSS